MTLTNTTLTNCTPSEGDRQVTIDCDPAEDNGSPLLRNEYRKSTDGGANWDTDGWVTVPLATTSKGVRSTDKVSFHSIEPDERDGVHLRGSGGERGGGGGFGPCVGDAGLGTGGAASRLYLPTARVGRWMCPSRMTAGAVSYPDLGDIQAEEGKSPDDHTSAPDRWIGATDNQRRSP